MAAGQLDREAAKPPRPAPWNDARIRGIVLQATVLIAVIAFFLYIIDNTATNLARRGIAAGFGFLDETAGFDIGFALLDFTAVSSYGLGLLVGLLNTILVALVGIVLATIVGFIVGIARLSHNWLIARMATVYVEILRNIPLLLQLIFWYYAVLSSLPLPRDSLVFLDSIFINNRGLTVPKPVFGEGSILMPLAFLLALALGVAVAEWARRRREATGQLFPTVSVALALIVVLPILAFFVAGRPIALEFAETGRFRLVGGLNLVPEFVALLLGLSLYTASFIAEIVRAGILAVNKGQWEAAFALGLKPNFTMRLVVIPQALRVIIPPLTSQYLNLTKNSSLAIAIGYPEIVSIGGTVMNQTGQAVEVVAIWMAVYLSLSLATSLFMNWYNRRMALAER